jgi:hypothetical protein
MHVNIPRHHLKSESLMRPTETPSRPTITHSLPHTGTTQLRQLSCYHDFTWNLLNLISIVSLKDNEIICKETKKKKRFTNS